VIRAFSPAGGSAFRRTVLSWMWTFTVFENRFSHIDLRRPVSEHLIESVRVLTTPRSLGGKHLHRENAGGENQVGCRTHGSMLSARVRVDCLNLHRPVANGYPDPAPQLKPERCAT